MDFSSCFFLFHAIGCVTAMIVSCYMLYVHEKYFRPQNLFYCFLAGFGSWVTLILLLYITLKEHYGK